MGLFDKAKDALSASGDKIESVSDSVLDKAEEIAADKLGADKAEKIHSVREKIDGVIGGNDSDDDASHA